MNLLNLIQPTGSTNNSNFWRNPSKTTDKQASGQSKSNTDFLSNWLSTLQNSDKSNNIWSSLLNPNASKNNSLLGNNKKTGTDSVSLTPSASLYNLQVQASLNLSFSSYQEVATANGYSSQKVSYNLSIDISYLQQAAGQITDSEAINQDPNQWLTDFFGPQKTADRILDFSLSWFENSKFFKEGGDTEESRAAFAEYIGAAIQKGFDQAQGLLGKLPDDIQGGIDTTHDIVWKGLDDFIANGLSKAKQENYLLAEEFRLNYQSSLTVETTQVTYGNIDGNKQVDYTV